MRSQIDVFAGDCTQILGNAQSCSTSLTLLLMNMLDQLSKLGSRSVWKLSCNAGRPDRHGSLTEILTYNSNAQANQLPRAPASRAGRQRRPRAARRSQARAPCPKGEARPPAVAAAAVGDPRRVPPAVAAAAVRDPHRVPPAVAAAHHRRDPPAAPPITAAATLWGLTPRGLTHGAVTPLAATQRAAIRLEMARDESSSCEAVMHLPDAITFLIPFVCCSSTTGTELSRRLSLQMGSERYAKQAE